MKYRAIKDLLQLSTDEFIKEISTGMKLIHENCWTLHKSIGVLVNSNEDRGAKILATIANEEAGKFFILLDAIRCPRENKKLISRQLTKFNEHLAKILYAESCSWRPSNYEDICRYIQINLDKFYLDGPQGIEYIYRNTMISKREESLYVDYVEYNDNEHIWLTPKTYSDLTISFPLLPVIMMDAIHSIGITNYNALKSFSEFWVEFEFQTDMHYQTFKDANSKSLKHLEKLGLLNDVPNHVHSLIVNELPFPLYKEEMKEKNITVKELKEIQNNWRPEY